MSVDFIQNAVSTIRQWMADNVNAQALSFPDEDQVWDFITNKWAMISTDNAETLLCEAMRPLN